MSRFGVDDWDAAVAAVRDAPEIVVACHVNPDGDALGSLLGASVALRARGAKTWPTWGARPVAVPPAYEFLPGVDDLVQPDDAPDAPVWLALDCGAGDRLGELEGRARRAPCVVNVDHHPGNDHFGTLNVVVPTASSTAQIVTHLLRDAGAAVGPDVATCLYTGIVTDTGWFQYASATPDVLRLAADLMAVGVDAPAIAQHVLESAPFGYLKLLGRVLERAVLHEEERLVYSWVTIADLRATGVAPDATEKVIDHVRATSAADVAAVFKEQDDGRYRVSLRSKGRASVGAIARANGGGGHELAAGFTAPDLDAAIGAVVGALRTS
ncbi:MAG TPA: bifunctional oligoribonuclease/PAP phosphatase NrnA [Actinomycetota bacterium]|nr:bifunctional oligoribonuclease/PAP phosphatase NrnA [Actinomycetota bacterium]